MTETMERTTGGKAASSPTRTPAQPDPSIMGGVEAALLASEKALTPARLAEALGIESRKDSTARIDTAIGALNTAYQESGRAFRIRKVAGGYRVMTLPDFAPVLERLRGARESQRLSKAAIESLAIIAYRQPITRAQIETIRGVACGDLLRALLERHLIAITGRAEELGRPMLYGTTRHFLEVFGLSSLKDLPEVQDMPELKPLDSGSSDPDPETGSVDGDQTES